MFHFPLFLFFPPSPDSLYFPHSPDSLTRKTSTDELDYFTGTISVADIINDIVSVDDFIGELTDLGTAVT